MDRSKLTTLLTKHEGYRKMPYVDTVGKVTIGIGHNLTDKGLTDGQVLAIFNADLDEALTFLASHCPWFGELDEVRQRAIADMTFNLMAKILDFKHMITSLEAKDWDGAADSILGSLFAAQTGQRAKDIALMVRFGADII